MNPSSLNWINSEVQKQKSIYKDTMLPGMRTHRTLLKIIYFVRWQVPENLANSSLQLINIQNFKKLYI